MTYASFVSTDPYASKHSGAGLRVRIVNEDDPADLVIGAVASLSPSDQYEVTRIEEAGEEIVNELVQGRHDGTATIGGFWTPEWGDNVPTPQNFIGRSFVISVEIAPSFPGAGTVQDAFVGCKINRVGSDFSARGARSLSVGFDYKRHYNGQEWADLTGA